MDFKQLKELSALPDNELTAKLVALSQVVIQYHDANKGMSPFDWHDLQISKTGSLYISSLTETALNNEVLRRNYSNYATIIYCICTKQKTAESMSWDAGSKIRQPVLREIVLAICDQDHSLNPLIAKLREPYIDEETFFKDYTTVAQKEAYAQAVQTDYASTTFGYGAVKQRSPWYTRVGIFLLMVLCYGGYKGCKAFKQQRHDAAVERNFQQIEEMRLHRDAMRDMPPVDLPLK